MTLKEAQIQVRSRLKQNWLQQMTITVAYMNTNFTFTFMSGEWFAFFQSVMGYPSGTGFPANYAVTDDTDSDIPMTWAQALTLIQMFITQGETIRAHYRTKVGALKATTTVQQAFSVTW